MVKLGGAFFFSVDRSHLWVVISRPEGPKGQFVIVNFTTLDEKICDESCVLQPSDYPEYILHPTVVYYIDAKLWWFGGPNGYDDLASSSKISPMPNLAPGTLLRIQQGALRSDFFPPDYKPMVQDSLVVLPAPLAPPDSLRPSAPRRPL